MAVFLLPSHLFSPISRPISSHIFSHILSPSSHPLLTFLFNPFYSSSKTFFSRFHSRYPHPRLHTMGTERAKGFSRGLNPDEQIEAALRDRLSEDKSRIDSNPVYRKLNLKSSQPRYDKMWEFCEVCVANITKLSLEQQALTPLRY
jgi:hypothetical protein